MNPGAPQESGVVCACGAPVTIRDSSECGDCYIDRCRRGAPTPARVTSTASHAKASRSRREPGKPYEPCSYNAAHWRVRAARGSASDWRCVRCGDRAEQWAYRDGSPRELSGEEPTVRRGKRYLVHKRWSPDPADYDPLCTPCHGKLTRPDWGNGYRHDPEYRRRLSREHHRAHYARQTATAEGRAAHLERKNRERRARRLAGNPSPSAAPHPARAWAHAVGIRVNTHGRIPSAVLSAWHAAGAPITTPAQTERNSVKPTLTPN